MKKKRIIVLGAGISGLSAGWFLKKRFGENIDLKIIERSDRPGGWVQTLSQDGFLFEQGPRSCRPHGSGVATLKLIEDLGLQDKILYASSSAYKRYLYINQKLNALPTGIFSLLFSPFRYAFLKAIFSDLTSATGSGEDESIYSFISRRMGSTIAEQFFDPLTAGIYAGDIRRLSMQSCFPVLHQWEQQRGSLIKGAFSKTPAKEGLSPFVHTAQSKGLFTLQGGMETLIKVLSERLKDELILGSGAKEFKLNKDNPKNPINSAIQLEDGSLHFADHFISALPPVALSDLLQKQDSNLAGLLRTLPSVSIAVVNFGYKENVLNQKGFGYLIPSTENEEILGVVWDSSAFPQQNSSSSETRLTVMIGGAHCSNFSAYTKEDLFSIAKRSLFKHLGISTQPESFSIKIACDAIPQYVVGHAEKVKKIENGLHAIPGNWQLLGNAFYGVSLNDCISQANKITQSYFL